MTTGGRPRPGGLLGAMAASVETTLARRRDLVSLADLRRSAETAEPRGTWFRESIGRPDRINIIAECKRRSPARGILAPDYDPSALAMAYEAGGAAAISVLTEPTFFDGELAHLEEVRGATTLPVLRKDFILDEYQLLEARVAGADAVLLIVALLGPGSLARLARSAADLGLAALVEVHTGEELAIAADAGASIIGVNSRDLRTLDVDSGVCEALIGPAPAGAVMVAESGLRGGEDIARLRACGYRAFLVGERLMRDADPRGALAMLAGARSRGDDRRRGAMMRTRIKICGITRPEDAQAAVDAGADALGFVFWPGSPRCVRRDRAAAIIRGLPAFVAAVGVFVNEPLDEICAVVEATGLDAIQLHGDEPRDIWANMPRRCIKAIGMGVGFEVADLAGWPPSVLPLLDVHDPARRGGSGQMIDWGLAAAASRIRRVVLAGGLDPLNVGNAVREVRPYAVDVSSGVEHEPGIKEHARLRAFVEGVRAADASKEP